MSVSQCPAIPAFIPTRSNQKQRRAAQRLARAGFSMKNIPPAPPPPPPSSPQQPAPRTTVGTMNAALSTSTNTSPSENTANSNGDMADIAPLARMKKLLLPEIARQGNKFPVAFPGEVGCPLFSLTRAQKLKIFRDVPCELVLSKARSLRLLQKTAAAENFVSTVMVASKSDSSTRDQRFEHAAREAEVPEMTLATTWQFAISANLAATMWGEDTLHVGSCPPPEGAMLMAAAIRWFERALGLTIEDIAGLGNAVPQNPEPTGAQNGCVGLEWTPEQIMDPFKMNLSFPAVCPPPKWYPVIPECVRSFFCSNFVDEHVQRTYDHVVVRQTHLRCQYGTRLKELFEQDWLATPSHLRYGMVAMALSNLYTRDDPLQLRDCEGVVEWLGQRKLKPRKLARCNFMPDLPEPYNFSTEEVIGSTLQTFPLHWRGEWTAESRPHALSDDPYSLFSLLGWLIGCDAPHHPRERSADPQARPFGFGECDFYNTDCPQCRVNFSLKLRGQGPPELGSRTKEPRGTPSIINNNGQLVTVVLRPRIPRNHVIEMVFGTHSSRWQQENSHYAVFQELVRLSNALFLTELAWEIINIVGKARRERIFFKLPDLRAAVEGVQCLEDGHDKKERMQSRGNVADLVAATVTPAIKITDDPMSQGNRKNKKKKGKVSFAPAPVFYEPVASFAPKTALGPATSIKPISVGQAVPPENMVPWAPNASPGLSTSVGPAAGFEHIVPWGPTTFPGPIASSKPATSFEPAGSLDFVPSAPLAVGDTSTLSFEKQKVLDDIARLHSKHKDLCISTLKRLDEVCSEMCLGLRFVNTETYDSIKDDHERGGLWERKSTWGVKEKVMAVLSREAR